MYTNKTNVTMFALLDLTNDKIAGVSDDRLDVWDYAEDGIRYSIAEIAPGETYEI